MKKRKYTKGRRAEKEAQTRERIVDATMALHEELGPAHTTIKAVAERAEVQRLTVYRHFSDEVSLFQACTSHWLELHPPPDGSQWKDIEEAGRRCHTALLYFYRYYRRTERMWHASYRDLEQVVALQGPMAAFERYLDQVRDDLLKAWGPTRETKKRLKITIRHGLRFATWQSLNNEKLNDEKIADLVRQWLQGVVNDS